MGSRKMNTKGISRVKQETFFNKKSFEKRKSELENDGYKIMTGQMSGNRFYIVYNTINH
jgi:hypothetical protein